MAGPTWDGVANGPDFSIEMKKQARAGVDLPEHVDIRLRSLTTKEAGTSETAAMEAGIAAMAIADMWRRGLLDLGYDEEKVDVILSMTKPQAEIAKTLRDGIA